MASGTALAWACLVSSTQADEHEPTRLAIAASEVDHVLGPTTAAFETTADALVDATTALAMAASESESTTRRDAARQAWIDAMAVWERAEVMQIGPAGSSAYVEGGEDLRDEIYAWPTFNACRIDEELVARGYETPTFFTESLVNVRGLAAIEYLLFNDSDANACDEGSTINEGGTWAALGADEIAKRRAAYAAAAAVRVAELAGQLADTWTPGSDFARWLSAPGKGGSPYEDGTDALDDVFGATGYIDTVMKDRKLGATTPEAVESPWAHRSKAHAIANLEGLRMILLGGDSAEAGTGFDDLLIELGEPGLADELVAAIDGALAAVGAIDGEFDEALADDPAALASAQASVQTLVDLIKGPVALALVLATPGSAAGDAD